MIDKMSIRVEAVLTETDVSLITEKAMLAVLEQVLVHLIQNEVLVLCCGQKFQAYVDKVQLNGKRLHDLYVQLSKPPTKLLDASRNACKVSHVNFDVPTG